MDGFDMEPKPGMEDQRFRRLRGLDGVLAPDWWEGEGDAVALSVVEPEEPVVLGVL